MMCSQGLADEPSCCAWGLSTVLMSCVQGATSSVMHGEPWQMLQARLLPRLLSFSQARQHATMGLEDVLRWCRMRSLDTADL